MSMLVMPFVLLIVLSSVVEIFKVCINAKEKHANYKIMNEILINKINEANKKIREQQYLINAYESCLKDKMKNTKINFYDNDVKEAVKYAMKKSHPDNGGNSEEFNRFRELYNKMK